MTESCPCGSGAQYSECCQCFLSGQQIPERPEQLMRSRYAAFVEQDEGYLLRTWHPATRPRHIDFDVATEWLGLEIEDAGMLSEDQGWVRFSARYRLADHTHLLCETSRFQRQEGLWFYLDGEHHGQPPLARTGRNQSCPCGSGKKYKRCCGR